MNPHKIIAEATAAGLHLALQGRNLVIRGVGVRPAPIIEAILAHKAEIMGLLQGMKTSSSEESEKSEESLNQRTGLPPEDLPLADTLQPPCPEARALVIDQVMKQGKPAIGWCLNRAKTYYLRFPGSAFQEQDAAAARDLLRWQGDDPELTP